MRVTHVTKSLEIIDGPGTTKLLEALIDYQSKCSDVFTIAGSVDLKFVVDDDHMARSTISVRMFGPMTQDDYITHNDKQIPGYKFTALLGTDYVEVTYYLQNADQYRGQITDKQATHDELAEYRRRLLGE